jgi:RND superfamily putative drug exporter
LRAELAITRVVATLLMLALAVPALGIRLGSADASSDPSDSDSHAYYEMMSGSFGDGFDAPLLVVASTPDAAAASAFIALTRQLTSVQDVTSVTVVPSRPGHQLAGLRRRHDREQHRQRRGHH